MSHVYCVLLKISAALIARKREAEQRAKMQEDQIKQQVNGGVPSDFGGTLNILSTA